MLHFSCDLCGRQLTDRRYVVRLEVYPAFDPDEICEEDLDIDHLQEVADTIEAMESGDGVGTPDSDSHEFRFDLCPSCHRRYCQDPLGREAKNRFNFSEN